MAELAARDGLPPPSDLPRGECIVTSLADGRIRVDRADPRVLISGEVLDAIIRSPSDAAWFEFTDCTATDTGVLKVKGVNRTVVYRITEYVAPVHGYIAEWPD